MEKVDATSSVDAPAEVSAVQHEENTAGTEDDGSLTDEAEDKNPALLIEDLGSLKGWEAALDVLGRIERYHTILEFEFSLLDLGQHGVKTLIAGLRDRSRRGYRFTKLSLCLSSDFEQEDGLETEEQMMLAGSPWCIPLVVSGLFDNGCDFDTLKAFRFEAYWTEETLPYLKDLINRPRLSEIDLSLSVAPYSVLLSQLGYVVDRIRHYPGTLDSFAASSCPITLLMNPSQCREIEVGVGQLLAYGREGLTHFASWDFSLFKTVEMVEWLISTIEPTIVWKIGIDLQSLQEGFPPFPEDVRVDLNRRLWQDRTDHNHNQHWWVRITACELLVAARVLLDARSSTPSSGPPKTTWLSLPPEVRLHVLEELTEGHLSALQRRSVIAYATDRNNLSPGSCDEIRGFLWEVDCFRWEGGE